MEDINNFNEESSIAESKFFEILKSIIYSSVGIFIFFIPINIDGQTTTFLYHMAYKVQSDMNSMLRLCIIVFATLGCIKPFIGTKGENKIISILRFFSLIIIINIFYGNKNILSISDNTIFLIEESILNLATLLPITSIFMTFLLEYGLLDIIESYFHKFMKNTYKMSGKTIVNILIYLFTDCFCGYFVTNNMYRKGKLRESEAIMLIANFSVSSIWMISYICEEISIKKLDIVIIGFIILSILNMIICRIYPCSKKKKAYYIKTNYKETLHKNEKLKKGFDKYYKNNCKRNIFREIINNIEECFQVIIHLIPNIVLILFFGDIILRGEIILDLIGYILGPILNALKLLEIEELTKFLLLISYNNILAIDSIISDISYTTKIIVGVLSITSCISISTNIAYMKYTNLSINTKELLIIFIQRIGLTICLYCLMNYAVMGYIT